MKQSNILKGKQNKLVEAGLRLWVIFWSSLNFVFNIEIAYYLSYGIFSFVAYFVHPFFFSFHLTEVVIRYQAVKNIIKSFWIPKSALALTWVLIIFILYIYALYSY